MWIWKEMITGPGSYFYHWGQLSNTKQLKQGRFVLVHSGEECSLSRHVVRGAPVHGTSQEAYRVGALLAFSFVFIQSRTQAQELAMYRLGCVSSSPLSHRFFSHRCSQMCGSLMSSVFNSVKSTGTGPVQIAEGKGRGYKSKGKSKDKKVVTESVWWQIQLLRGAVS